MQFGDFSPSFIKTATPSMRSRKPCASSSAGNRRTGGRGAAGARRRFLRGVSADVEETAAAAASDAAEESASEGPGAGRIGRRRRRAPTGVGLPHSQESRSEDPSPYMILRALPGRAPCTGPHAGPVHRGGAGERTAGETEASDRGFGVGQSNRVDRSDHVAAGGRFWLDLQRYAPMLSARRAMHRRHGGEQSAPYPAGNPAGGSGHYLPRRHSGANAETKEWIENFVVHQKVTPPPPPAEDSSSSDSSSDFSFDSTPSTDETPSWIPRRPRSPRPSLKRLPSRRRNPNPSWWRRTLPSWRLRSPRRRYVGRIRHGACRCARRPYREAWDDYQHPGDGAQRTAAFPRRTQLAHLLMAAGKGKVAQPCSINWPPRLKIAAWKNGNRAKPSPIRWSF